MHSVLTPMLALVCWTLVMWWWMYLTRIPAMREAKLLGRKNLEKHDLDVLPREVRQVADNYNHLHEQPVLFYALTVYAHLVGLVDPLTIGLAWAYVGFRVAHSLWQAISNVIPVRFALFSLASLTLMVIAIRDVIALVHPS